MDEVEDEDSFPCTQIKGALFFFIAQRSDVKFNKMFGTETIVPTWYYIWLPENLQILSRDMVKTPPGKFDHIDESPYTCVTESKPSKMGICSANYALI